MFDTKFFCIEAKFILAKLGRTHHILERIRHICKRFHEKALDYYDMVVEDVLWISISN